MAGDAEHDYVEIYGWQEGEAVEVYGFQGIDGPAADNTVVDADLPAGSPPHGNVAAEEDAGVSDGGVTTDDASAGNSDDVGSLTV